MKDLPLGSVHDYDFLAGEWNVRNRRLRVRGVGSDEWEEFPARRARSCSWAAWSMSMKSNSRPRDGRG